MSIGLFAVTLCIYGMFQTLKINKKTHHHVLTAFMYAFTIIAVSKRANMYLICAKECLYIGRYILF